MKLIYTKEYVNNPEVVLILAHGAGAPADSSFMEALASALEKEGIACVRFEFPYMVKRREDGKKRPPDRQPKLLECFSGVVDAVLKDVGPDSLVLIGGKSMGGRMATLLATEKKGIEGVACFGYPFHPPGKLDRWRTDHFKDVEAPVLIVQGTRDPFGKPDEVADHLGAQPGILLHWLEGGNHDFQPPVRLQKSQQGLIEEAAAETRRFIDENLNVRGR
ncbi:alpha/beta family hydrolase [Marinobacter salinexigens]|uniref:alpha/beta family hydrolase n=1 Tax=Marinobacter salinexigens TaxID=2919747 RepID=UPI001FE7D591|nr:alpha/beta family hydrolase [Marinobacter salinexigens]